MIHNIPAELRALPQWVVAGPNKIPLNPKTGQAADVTDATTWGSFEEAVACGHLHVGFVLSTSDPYTVIDLDDPTQTRKQPEPDAKVVEERIARHRQIIETFETYSEISQSGNGLHIICRGKIPSGARRDCVEVYPSGRYIICTGQIHRNLPIIDCQNLLTILHKEMTAPAPSSAPGLIQVDGPQDDESLWTQASTAANAEKFMQLWQGQWQGMAEYPSQSEADYALLSMLCFYSKDNAQVRRMFRYSELGKRDKATKNDKYLDRALQKIRGNEIPRVDFSKLAIKSNFMRPGPQPQTELALTPDEPAAPKPAPLDFPPGLIGEMAQYILESAIRPVPEIALAAAIALAAGVGGRSFNISNNGLNQYLIVIARTGSGKEGAANGIDALINAVKAKVPLASDFIGPSAFASGQALIRVLDKQPCFVSVLGEFGLTLQQLNNPRANAAQLMLKKVLLDVYVKSGFRNTLYQSAYSDTERNTKTVRSPNVTILGESTPEEFFKGLDVNTIAEGLIPRFSIFEYEGPRPKRNRLPFTPPDAQLVEKLALLFNCGLAAQSSNVVCPVQIDTVSQKLLDDFDELCDKEMNASKFNMVLQLWNRAHLKVLKLAALIAVGVNPHQPIVDRACAEWAIKIITDDVNKLLAHFEAGEIGTGDVRMEADLRRAVNEYLAMSPRERAGYSVPTKLLDQPVIPLGYLRRRLRPLASFRNDRRGVNAALAAILKSMSEAGEFLQANPLQVSQHYSVSSPIYYLGPQW